MSEYKHSCSIENAPKFAEWIKGRGGVAVWQSVNLANPGVSWSTPAHQKCAFCAGRGFTFVENEGQVQCVKCGGRGYGDTMTKPAWQAANTPTIFTDPAEIEVYEPVVWKRFHVGVRIGCQGMFLKVTDGGSRRIRAELKKAGEGSYHEFNYGAHENCLIYKTVSKGSLKDWIEQNGG